MDRGEEDYFIGGYLLNFVGAELVIVAAAFFGILLTWPDVPWKGLTWGLAGLMVPCPMLTYPFSKKLWLAVDLTFRPTTPADFTSHEALAPA